jgi:hypothetical protein
MDGAKSTEGKKDLRAGPSLFVQCPSRSIADVIKGELSMKESVMSAVSSSALIDHVF